MTRTRLITVLGSLTIVILAVASWLLVLSPRVAEAAEIQSQSESVHEQASGVQRDIVKLQAMKDKLPDRMARFDQLKANFPGTAEIPALLDQIRDAAAQSGVSVLELKTSAPVRVSHDAKAGAATNGANGTSTPAPAGSPDASAGAGANGAGVPGASASGDTLASMPVSLTVSGSYENLTHFLDRAENLPRAWLIDKLTATGDASGKSGISLTASGGMFVLDANAITAPGSAPSSVPAPSAAAAK